MTYRVAIDANGGDPLGDQSVAARAVPAALSAAVKYPDITFLLYGDAREIESYLASPPSNIVPVNATGHRGALHKLRNDFDEGLIDGLYTSGKTEKVLPAINGVGLMPEFSYAFPGQRIPPLIAELPKSFTEVPTKDPKIKEIRLPRVPTWFLLDGGSIPELTEVSQYLAYAHIATIYATNVKGRKDPYVGLHNIGREPNKGTKLLQQAYNALEQELGSRFQGNVETYLAFNDCEKGKENDIIPIDIVICSGAIGNTIIKDVPAAASMAGTSIKYRIKTGNLLEKIAGLILKRKGGVFERAKKDFDSNTYNGALFAGFQKPIIKGHGTANAEGFYNGIEKVVKCLEKQVVQQMQKAFV